LRFNFNWTASINLNTEAGVMVYQRNWPSAWLICSRWTLLITPSKLVALAARGDELNGIAEGQQWDRRA